MLEKIIIGLVVLLAAIYLVRRTLKKGGGCGCSGSDCASGGCCSGKPSGGGPGRTALDIPPCGCQGKDR